MINCNNGRTLQKKILVYASEEANRLDCLSNREQIAIFEEIYRQMIKSRLTIGSSSEPANWKSVDDVITLKKGDEISFPRTFAVKSRVASSQAVAMITVEYEPKIDSVDVRYFVSAATEELTEKYKEKFEEELLDIALDLESISSKNLFIKTFFDVLNSCGLSTVVGRDAVHMNNINTIAPKHFLLFKGLPKSKKVDVLRRAYFDVRRAPSNLRDIHMFAMATFEQFVIAGLDRVVYKYDYVLSKDKTFTKIGESPKTFGHNGCPIFIDYECSSKEGNPKAENSEEVFFRTSIHSGDLWGLLAKMAG